MQHFQSILFILGIFAILAVLLHGYMISRKKQLPSSEESLDSEQSVEESASNEQHDFFENDALDIKFSDTDENCNEFSFSSQDENIEDLRFTTEPSLDNETLASSFDIAAETDLQEKPEPAINSEINQYRDLDEDAKDADIDFINKPAAVPEDFFVFNVAAKEGATVRGHELLQFFLTAGFRFGEMSIFHRHENSDGTGPVLFSIANMMQPGTFDVDNMEQFSSAGVSFFLAAPNKKINVKKAFDMMLVAVEQMAEEFDCIVLNENREPLTEAQFRNYHERLLRYV